MRLGKTKNRPFTTAFSRFSCFRGYVIHQKRRKNAFNIDIQGRVNFPRSGVNTVCADIRS